MRVEGPGKTFGEPNLGTPHVGIMPAMLNVALAVVTFSTFRRHPRTLGWIVVVSILIAVAVPNPDVESNHVLGFALLIYGWHLADKMRAREQRKTPLAVAQQVQPDRKEQS